MSILKKKRNNGQYNVLTDKYVPATLPSSGLGLENFVTSEYSMTKREVIEEAYREAEAKLDDVIATCDHHSAGSECDHYIDNEIEHILAVHEAEVADHDNQITRIHSAREMRMKILEQTIAHLKKKIAKLESEIEPLEGLRSQFQIHVGRHAVSIGLPITIIAMIVDSCVNYSFIQSVLLSNAYLLWITVICMSIMSDGSMWALGTFLSHRGERFTSKPLYYSVCASLLSMFLLSVVASVMIRWGSMDITYGTINAAGAFVGKDSYSLAEYGVTLISAFVTTATGILSFGFSLDENAFLISVRDRKKRELAQYLSELTPLLNELSLLENAPNPQERDELKRFSAERHIKAIRTGLKLHCRKQMTITVNDPDFTEKMAASGGELSADFARATSATMHTSPINLNKVC